MAWRVCVGRSQFAPVAAGYDLQVVNASEHELPPFLFDLQHNWLTCCRRLLTYRRSPRSRRLPHP